MTPDLASATWRKASRSGGEGGNCIELARVEASGAARDSKHPDGPALRVDLPGFLSAIKEDRVRPPA